MLGKAHRPVFYLKHDIPGPETRVSSVHWDQLSRYYLKTETQFSLQNAVFYKQTTERWIMSRIIIVTFCSSLSGYFRTAFSPMSDCALFQPCLMLRRHFFPRAKHSIVENRTSYKVHLKLTINQFSRRDQGIYMCVSTNSLGHADGTVRLYGKCLS
jgi:hypothetical protein